MTMLLRTRLDLLRACFASLLCCAWLCSLAQPAPPTPMPTPTPAEAAQPTLLQQFLQDPSAREMPLDLVSDAYREDPSNPALMLTRMWTAQSGTLLELKGLPRRGQQYSALIRADSLRLVNLQTEAATGYLGSDGGFQLEDRDGTKLLRVQPDERVLVFMGPIDGLQPHRLGYLNAMGKEDSYFDRIDPSFKERYDTQHAQATAANASVDDMKAFLLGFVSQDPDNRVRAVFTHLITRLRGMNSFEGHYQAYLLIKDPADEKAASQLAQTEEQRNKLNAAIEAVRQAAAAKKEQQRLAAVARQAELRKRDEARLADLRRQAEVRIAEQRMQQTHADEARCLQNPKCRAAWQMKQAQCNSKIMACRENCDRAVNAGGYGSFMANLTSSFMARACYAGCKCDGSFAELVDKFNQYAKPDSGSGVSASIPVPVTASKTYQCKVYCISAQGPTVTVDIKASSRREAARQMGQKADEICRDKGLSHGSNISFPEKQCQER